MWCHQGTLGATWVSLLFWVQVARHGGGIMAPFTVSGVKSVPTVLYLVPRKKFRSLLVNPCRVLLTMPVESMSQITASIHRIDLGGNSTSIDFSMGMGNKFWCSSTRDRFKVTSLRGQRDKKPVEDVIPTRDLVITRWALDHWVATTTLP